MGSWKRLLLCALLAYLPVATASEPTATPVTQREVRSLPPRLTLIYDVRMGDGGLTLGQGTYTWQAGGGRYHLESVARATGLTALVMSGQIRQRSEGRLEPGGLVPQQFWQVRGAKKPETARFDWGRHVMVLRKGEEELRQGGQDLLSFPFHLALTVAETDPAWDMPVTNGRYMKDYRFHVLGRERLRAVGEMLDTLHVQGSRAEDGSLDVWLAPTHHWLPVRIRTQDNKKGTVMQLTLARIKD